MINSKTSQNVAAGTATSVGGLAGIMITVRQIWPEFSLWPVEADAAVIAVLTTVLIPAVSRLIAFWRDPSKANQSLKVRNYHRILPFILVPALASGALSGCIGMSPALMGKSNYKVDFVDTVTPDGGQNTEFHSSISAPAGDIAKIDPGATYTWNEGTGQFSVSGKGDIDSTAQAVAITEVGKQQLEAINLVLNALSPVLNQKIQSDDNQAAIAAESDPEKIRAAIELIDAWNRQNANR